MYPMYYCRASDTEGVALMKYSQVCNLYCRCENNSRGAVLIEGKMPLCVCVCVRVRMYWPKSSAMTVPSDEWPPSAHTHTLTQLPPKNSILISRRVGARRRSAPMASHLDPPPLWYDEFMDLIKRSHPIGWEDPPSHLWGNIQPLPGAGISGAANLK